VGFLGTSVRVSHPAIVVLTPHYACLVPLFISLLQLIHISRIFRCLFVESQAYTAVYIQRSLL
jgi:hypothetical protein